GWLLPDIPPLRGTLASIQLPGWAPGLIFFLNLGIVGQHLKRTGKKQLQVGKQSRILKAYGKLLGQIENFPAQALLLTAQQKELETKGEKASEAIYRLGELAGMLDQRLNVIIGLLFNGMLLWDIRYVSKLEQWKESYHDQLLPWIDKIGDWDVWQSLSRNHYNYPEHCFPNVLEGEFQLQAQALGHPLLKADTRVCNDMDLGKPGEFLVVTGANMAGKSTFLRTVGTNLILARCGGVVCAERYEFAPIPLITSIRTHDSLEDNESYFYAELKQLKKIIDRLKEGTVFIIVDEMLRGTNSRDKQTGSRKFIEQLIQLRGVGMIATHDLALGELADE
ncbi:MAG: DNA mismatch repair protein MutS, partial [Bacteroidota bacterium]